MTSCKPATTSSLVSSETRPIKEILTDIETMTDLSSTSPLLPRNECLAVIEVVDRAGMQRCSPPDAVKAARMLLGVYRRGEIQDPEMFVTAVAATFAQFPPRVVDKVIDPVSGLPSTSKFLPSVAEVRQALEAAKNRLMAHRWLALGMMREQERRDLEARQKAEEDAITDEEREERRRRVEEILARVQAANVVEG